MVRWVKGIVAASTALACMGASQSGRAADYYTGKSIEMLVGADVGGGYDIYARLVARHMSRHIPGAPTIVARNMPGAGSAIAGAQLYSKSAKDGTVIGALMPGAIMGRILDDKASNLFDPTKFVYVGTADSGTRVCITMANAATKTYEDALRQRTIMGASQAGGATRDYEAMHNHATGTKFEIVSGYKGTSDLTLAMERGETAGLCGFDWSSLKSQKPDWIRDKAINILVQDALEPDPELTAMGVPTIWPYIKNDLDKRAVELVLSQQLFGRSYVLPPGAAPEAVAILRKAFAATVIDPEFLADAAKSRVSITASTGERLQEVVARVHSAPKEVVARARQVIEP